MQELVDAAVLDDFCNQCGIKLSDVRGIGICIPMAVSLEGIPAKPPNMDKSWLGFSLKDEIADKIGIETFVINDGNAVARGECGRLFKDDKERATKSVIALSCGTGLACGLVFNGRAYLGEDGYAGEGGHCIFDPSLVPGVWKTFGKERLRCGCGSPGCIEPYVSLSGLKQVASRWSQEGDLKLAADHKLWNQPNNEQWAERMLGLADKGDEICLNVFKLQAACLGFTFGGMINLLNPSRLVLGGGIVKTSQAFKDTYLEAFDEGMTLQGMCFIHAKYDRSRIIFSDYYHAAAYGAALHAQDLLAA